MATAKTKIRKTFLVLLCMILVYTLAGHSFLGPGISSAATTIGTITATDTVSPIGGQVETMATSATQVKNVLVRVTMNRSDIRSAVAEVYGTNTAKLHKYDKVDITLQQLKQVIRSNWITENGADVIIQTNDYQANQNLVDLYFNVSNQESTPLNCIACTMTNKAFTVEGEEVSDVFQYTKMLMGDVNGDNLINAEDAQKILKAAVDTLDPPLTDSQELAADVNEDGEVDAEDASAILNYGVVKINSFWDDEQVVLPTEPNDEVVHQGWYRIKNAQTAQYIMGGNTEATKYQASVGTTTNTKAACLKFKINQVKNNGADTGYYSLRCLYDPADTLYLKLDSDYELTLAYGQGEYLTYSGHWYLLPQSDGSFRMVNRAVPKRALTDFGYIGAANPKCEAGYCEPGSYWILEPVLTIAYYYDEAYLERNSSAQSVLTASQNDIATVIKYVFGVNPVVETPDSIATHSFADDCDKNNLNGNCNCSGRTPTTCSQYRNSLQYQYIHHKNANSMLLQFYRKPPKLQGEKINVITSGVIPCYVDDATQTHYFKSNTFDLGGLSNRNKRVAAVFTNVSSTVNRNYYSALHEISHCIGAKKGTDSKVDTKHNIVDGKGRCIMSTERDNDYLLAQWNSHTAEGYGNLFCTDCYDMIQEYLFDSF